MTQGDLFRDEGIKRVEKNADCLWISFAYEAALIVAGLKAEFTTDDIWDRIDMWQNTGNYDDIATHDNRAMGAVMRKAQANGWIEPTDRVVKSNRPVCHSRPIRVWRSKLI